MSESVQPGDVALVDAAQDAIIVRDSSDRIVFWNRGAQSLYGWSRREALGLATRELLRTRPVGSDPSTELDETGVWNGLLHHRTRDHGDVTVWSRWTSIRDAEGEVHSTLQIDRDVGRMLTLVDSLRDAIVVATQDLRIVAINSAASQLLGIEPSSVVGESVERFFSLNEPPHHAWSSVDGASAHPESRPANEPTELVVRRGDGSERPVEMTLTRETLADSSLYVFSLRDIASRLLLEDQVRETQKTEVIGRLAGGIAEDFSRLLDAITGCLERARPAVTDDAALSELDGAKEAATRAGQLTQQLLMLSRTDGAPAR